VIGPNGQEQVYATPDGNACLQVSQTECTTAVQQKCGDNARADVIVDNKGKTNQVICYPVNGAPVRIVDPAGEDTITTDNGSVVVLDNTDDGTDLKGNVSLGGNDVVLYGQGSGVSVIGGSLRAEGNNATVRGVTVQGPVTLEGNNSNLLLCVIYGDVVLASNNNVIANCTIFGKVMSRGNNNFIYNSRIEGGVESEGQNLLCDNNIAFADANDDKVIADNELGAPVTCGPANTASEKGIKGSN